MAATATYRDPWAGPVEVKLLPKAIRGAIVYRWRKPDGTTCDGLRRGFGRERMMAHAKANATFSNVREG